MIWPEEPPAHLHFRVNGIPTTQGSKRGFFNPKTERVIIVDDNSPNLKRWRQDVIDAAKAIRGQIAGPLDVPIELEVVFYLPRPQIHYGAHGLKPNAPLFVKGKPDLDKLIRAVMDAITIAGLWQDDGRVASIKTRKLYSDEPGCEVRLGLLV